MTNLDIKGHDPAANPESPNPDGRAPEFAVASAPSYARTLFLGPDGLRVGWGLAFYAVSFLILQRLLVDLAWSHDWGASGLWSSMLAEFASLLAAVIPSLVLARVEQRPWSAYGLPPSWLGGRSILYRQPVGIRFHHAPHFRPVRLSCLFLRACCPARLAYLEVRSSFGPSFSCWLDSSRNFFCAATPNSRSHVELVSGLQPWAYRVPSDSFT